jgi:hypothetical protein
MLPRVHEYVDERVPDRARRGQRPRVEAVREDAPAAADDAVDGFREPDRETTDPIRQGASMLCLRDQMDVVTLDRVFDNAKLRARRRGQGAADRGEDATGAERAEGRINA